MLWLTTYMDRNINPFAANIVHLYSCMQTILCQNIYVHAVVCMSLWNTTSLEYTQKHHHVWIAVPHCRDATMLNAHIVLETQGSEKSGLHTSGAKTNRGKEEKRKKKDTHKLYHSNQNKINKTTQDIKCVQHCTLEIALHGWANTVQYSQELFTLPVGNPHAGIRFRCSSLHTSGWEKAAGGQTLRPGQELPVL